MTAERIDHINQVRIAADQLTLACSSIVGPVAATVGAASSKLIGERLPHDMVNQLIQIERASRRKDGPDRKD